MRLWSINPKLLDRMGLLGLWREALQAQRILLGGPPYKGPYSNHPQFKRFKDFYSPKGAIISYLRPIYDEGKSRGYNFNKELISTAYPAVWHIPVPRGQLNYELRLLVHKLKKRSPAKRREILEILFPYGDQTPAYERMEIHPVFKVDPFDLTPASWEKTIEGI